MSVLQSSVNWVLQQAKLRLGLPYVYGACYSPSDLTQGADCSGVGGWVLQALVNLPQNIPVWSNGQWAHAVSTESWWYDYKRDLPAPDGAAGPFGTVCVGMDLNKIPADAALTVNIMHRGGGPDSHMNVVVPVPNSVPWQGVIAESNGDAGSCTNGTGGNPATAGLWTDHWYLPGPWVFDNQPDQPPTTPTISYTVKPGDDLITIAADFRVTLAALEAVNPGISNPSLIRPGQVINIP
jgi:LysM domain